MREGFCMSAVLQIFVGVLASVFIVATVLSWYDRLTLHNQTDVVVLAMVTMTLVIAWIVYQVRA
jgi:hypothetical protein